MLQKSESLVTLRDYLIVQVGCEKSLEWFQEEQGADPMLDVS